MLNANRRIIASLLKSARIAARTHRHAAPLSLLRPTFSFSTGKEVLEFKAETKKLLDIVAKSLYTDSEVFVRELLSNASDALEKQRFKEQSSADLTINVELFPAKNQLVIQDNGIGMSRQALIDLLGTIARSGSKEFVQGLESETGSSSAKDNIIGQFGVGFYSAFIVSDLVEVTSREEGGPANRWSSDGSGTFEVQEVEDEGLSRGTKIVLHIKEGQKKFVEKT
jgi:TNF receptor-associated protein 1